MGENHSAVTVIVIVIIAIILLWILSNNTYNRQDDMVEIEGFHWNLNGKKH